MSPNLERISFPEMGYLGAFYRFNFGDFFRARQNPDGRYTIKQIERSRH